MAEVEAERSKHRKKLANEKFVANAPEEVVAEERRRLAEAESLHAKFETSLAQVECQ
jgi:valyl-tRNA synthetase